MPHVPPPGPADVAVRARADAPPVTAGPVEQVVPAHGARRRRPVGDLVPAQAGRGQQLVGGQVPVGHHVVVRRGQLPAADPGGQPGALLDDQRVAGDVVGPGGHRAAQRRGPVLVGLPRGPVDQVQADVLEPCRAGPPDAPLRPSRLMPAVQNGQHAAHRALHADRDPGEPARPQLGQGPAGRASPGSPRRSPRRPAARPNSSSIARRIAARSAGGSSVGVPPPKNTVPTGQRRGAEHPAGQPDLARSPGPRRCPWWRRAPARRRCRC